MSRLEMKGALSELKLKKMNLIISADSKIKAIKDVLALSAVTPLDEINIDAVALLSEELKALKEEYLDTQKKINALKKELGEK